LNITQIDARDREIKAHAAGEAPSWSVDRSRAGSGTSMCRPHGLSNLFASPYFFAYPPPPPFEKLLAHTTGLAARYGTASLRNHSLARR
jgi:hypothetical protein